MPQDEAPAAAFETGLSHLRRYVAAHGTSNARRRDVIDGFPIGTWVQSRRAAAPTTAKACCRLTPLILYVRLNLGTQPSHKSSGIVRQAVDDLEESLELAQGDTIHHQQPRFRKHHLS